MRLDLDLLSTTIAELYSGVGHANAFKAALQRIGTLFGSSRVTLVTRLGDHECLYYEDRRDAGGTCVAGAAPRALDDAVPGPIARRAGRICSNCAVSKRASRLCCCITDCRADAGLPSIHLSVHREAGSPPFDDSDRRTLARLAPHVLQAVHLSSRIEVAEAACSMGRQVLEEVRRGVVVLDARKEVVFMNGRAEAICAGARGVNLSRRPSGHRTLRAASPAEDLELQRAIEAAMSGESAARHGPGSDAVRIGCSQSGRPLLLRVARLAPASVGGQGRAVIFIDDLAVKELGDDRMLTALFGLTRAEARVAGALLAGERPKAIAARFAVSEDTVRTQLRAIYAKTETHGLASLLALLSRLADVPVLDICEAEVEATALTRVRPIRRSANPVRFAP